METFVKPKMKRNDNRAKYEENKYLERTLLFYINKNKKTTRINNCGRWVIEEDHDTLLRQQLFDYILGHFNLYELYVVFFNPVPYTFTYSNNVKARHKAIQNINWDDSLTLEETKKLKQKVWDINPILFGLLLELINLAELFWDKEKKSVVYPGYRVA